MSDAEGQRAVPADDDAQIVDVTPQPVCPTAAKPSEHKGQGTGGSGAAAEEEEEATRVDILEYAHVVVDILVPVTITMLLVVVAVRLLNMSLAGGTVSFAGFVYTESTEDSTATKLFGSLLNAVIFLAIIIGVTFLLVLLYKCNCVKLILAWLVFSVLLLFGAIGGFFVYQLVANLNWPLDYISFAVLIANATVVGAIATFWVAPRWLNQAALIVVSFLVATYFTQLPEWTTWAILIIIACYDLFAVLCPRGPLKMLLDTAQERNEPIPALLYNASVSFMMADSASATPAATDGDVSRTAEQAPSEDRAGSDTPMLSSADRQDDPEVAAAGTSTNAVQQEQQQGPRRRKPLRRKRSDDDDEGGVKLGLGDFVFYSVLIGRAAMTDMLTVFTSYFAIVTGLFGTLILLGLFKRALPALPISIALGTLFYFLSRVFLRPFVISNALDEVSI